MKIYLLVISSKIGIVVFKMSRNDANNSEDYFPPAEGERRAITGYYNQYNVSAYITLKYLRNNRLNWIRIADRNAKQVDDFQISNGSRIDAFQVKWGQYPNSFSFNDLIKTSLKSPKSLMFQLAEGWKYLSEIHPNKRIVVHLITNHYPNSKQASIPYNKEFPPTPHHFAAFIEQAWKPFKKQFNVPDEWEVAWNKLQSESGLNEDEFKKFARDCELEFNYNIHKPDDSREKEIFDKDMEHLNYNLFYAVADPSRPIELSYNELMERLNWSSRTEYRNRHEFPVDENLYQPIISNVDELNNALNNLAGGYIGVFGTPGSGKSTFLSQFLRSRAERVIFYYAYVPDSHDSIIKRGESENFLHDIIVSLNYEGFNVGQNLSLDVNQLSRYFQNQIQLLNKDWKENGQKTIILIDGLDHIDREQKPKESLLKYLPDPNDIPNGVYFILGSQTYTILPKKIQAVILRDRNRKIVMHPLIKDDVFHIIDRTEFSRLLSGKQKNKIFHLSDGHPLALSYILNHLDNVNNKEQIDHILDTTEIYKGDIEVQYASYWGQIEDEYELKHLIGLLSRLRSFIDINWVKTWDNGSFNNKKVLSQFIKKFAHYFRIEENRWYFFHNSFRLFLQEKTSELLPGNIDSDQDQTFHREIAEKCSKTENSYWSWEELYHRAKAGENQKVLEQASQSYFRDQFFSFRPIDSIKTDIKFALKSAAICQDHVALTRLILISSEIEEREVNLNIKSIITLLFKLNKKQMALGYIRDGNKLRIEPKDALELIPELINVGLKEEAKKIFELAEPLNIIHSSKPIENDFENRMDLLISWANSAIYFKNIHFIIEAIRRITKLPVHSRPQQFKELNLSRSFQNKILYEHAFFLLENRRDDDAEKIKESFELDAQDIKYWVYSRIQLICYYFNKGCGSKANSLFKDTLKDIKKHNITIVDYDTLLIFSEVAYNVMKNRTLSKEFIKDVPQPQLFDGSTSFNDSIEPFWQRFSINRLLYALGSNELPEDIIEEHADPTKKPFVKFERFICDIACIWAKFWLNEEMNIEKIEDKTHILLDLFYSSQTYSATRYDNWSSWYSIKKEMGNLFELFIDAVGKHSTGLERLQRIFEEEWQNKDWPIKLRRKIILSLVNNGVNRQWAIEELKKLENKIWEGYNVSGRTEECLKQSKAWLRLDETEFAYKNLEKMLDVSFGIYAEKDYQLSTWIKWLGRFINLKPEKGEELIKKFAHEIVFLEETTDSTICHDASAPLINITFDWSPINSLKLSKWLIDHSIVDYENIITSILDGALKSNDPPLEYIVLILTNLLFPLNGLINSETMFSLLNKIYRGYGKDKMLEIVKYMVSKVKTITPKSFRTHLLENIAKGLNKQGIEYAEVNIEDVDFEHGKDNGYSHEELELEDSKKLNLKEVKSRISSVDDLGELMVKEKRDSFFEWNFIIEDLIQNLNKEDTLKLNTIIHNNYKSISKYKSSFILSTLSKKIYEYDKKLAWNLGLESLKVSNSYGWVPHIDGGSRLSAFEALINADKDKARELLYNTLSDDIYNGIDSKNVALNLDRILPLVTDKILIKDIWFEIEEYVDFLLRNNKRTTIENEIEFCDILDDTPSEALAYFIVSNLNNHVNFIFQSSQRICVHLLFEEDKTIKSVITDFLGKNEDYQESILMILDAVSLKDPCKIGFARDKIMKLQKSPNYLIRRLAWVLGRRIKCYSFEEINKVDLPRIYFKDIPPKDIFGKLNDEISSDQFLSDSNDPLEIIIPFNHHIHVISLASGVPEINICYRIVEIMNELDNPESWSEAGERELRMNLDSLGLRLTFNRPRVILVRRAIFHVISELIDAKKLEIYNLLMVSPLFRFHDPAMILKEPLRRPSYIKDSFKKCKHQNWTQGSEKWTENVLNSFNNSNFKIYGDKVIIAENTLLKFLDGESSCELRKNKLYFNDKSVDLNKNSFFYKITNGLVEDYLDHETPLKELFIQNASYGYESQGQNWLALNPNIAYQLGWELDDSGLFRWINEEGKVMVESIWWADGVIDQFRPTLDEVGEGWMVLASKEAINDIRSQYGLPKRLLNVKCFKKGSLYNEEILKR